MADGSSMHVELVAADRLVWSGEARMVLARTSEGDVGILPNHAPMLSLMVDGTVDVTTAEGETWIAAVDAGFLSVAGNRISVLAEHAEMSHEIDLERARHDLERCRAAGENPDDAADAAARVEVGATLADDDLAGVDGLAAEALHAEALRVRVAAVAGRRCALLVCHVGVSPSRCRGPRRWSGADGAPAACGSRSCS